MGILASKHKHNQEFMHVAMVASIGYPPYGRHALATVRSGLFFAHHEPLHFHLMVDDDGQQAMNDALDTLEPWLHKRGRFQLYGKAGLLNRGPGRAANVVLWSPSSFWAL